MKIICAFFISFFAINASGLCSVKNDTIPKPKVIAHRFSYDFTTMDSIAVDTLLANFQMYTPAYNFKAANITIGDLSAPVEPLNYRDRLPFQDFLFTQFTRYYLHNPEEMLYYSARKPFTVVNYEAEFPGMKNEQKLNILHTQSINKVSNIGALFDLNYEFGNYLNSKATSSAVSLFGNYRAKRYSFNANMNLNKVKLNENGGLLRDDSYTNGLIKYDLPVNLKYANSLTKEFSFFINQRLYLTGSYKDDSIRGQSKWKDVLSLIHTLKYQRSSRSFRDDLNTHALGDTIADSSYYHKLKLGNPKYNNDSTIDSVFFRRFENTIQLAFNTSQWLKIPAELRIGFKNQLDFIYMTSLDSTVGSTKKAIIFTPHSNQSYINSALVGSLSNRFSPSTSWGGSLEYYFTGYKRNDLEIKGDISKAIRHNFVMRLSGRFATTRPGYFMEKYKSNLFNWSNNFNQQQSFSVKLSLGQLKRKFFIDGQVDNHHNYVYLNESAVPQQTSPLLSVYSLKISKLIDWGIFHTDLQLIFQKTNNDHAIAIPSFSGFNSSYLSLQLFNKEMKLNFGYDLYYNTAYFVDAYMPYTGLYHSQRNVKLGDYPTIDAFVNLKIKRIRFFFKYEYLNELIFTQKKFFSPHYPVDPLSSVPLKFGLSWTFYD